MHQGGESALRRSAEGHTLDGVRSIPDPVVHIAPRQHHLDWTPHYPGPKRRQRDMRPGAQPRAERAADKRRDDADVLRRNAEDGRNLVGRVVHPLRLVPQRQAVAVPHRNGGVHLNRVVVLAWDHIGLVDLDLGGSQRFFSIAAPRLR